MKGQLAAFELTNKFYGINIVAVESVIKMQAITQFLQTHLYVKRMIHAILTHFSY